MTLQFSKHMKKNVFYFLVVSLTVINFSFTVFSQESKQNLVTNNFARRVNNSAQDKETSKEEKQRRTRFRTGVLSSSLYGTSGGFTIFDAETLYKGKYLIGGGFNSFGRPGKTRFSQLNISAAYGVTERFEIFFSMTPLHYANVNAPQQLSGSLLKQGLAQPNAVRSSALFNNQNGFFPLHGLIVSGALVGSILPGIAQGINQSVNDPILGITKQAFTTPSFLNDYPFTAQSGMSWGNSLFGGKFRLASLKDKNKKNPQPGTLSEETSKQNKDDTSELFSSAILGYVKIPFYRDGNIFNLSQGSNLFKGSGSGNFDFGFFITTSNYFPVPLFGKKKKIVPRPDDLNCPLLTGILRTNQTTGNITEGESITEETVIDYYTLNFHTNHGYIRNTDPHAGGFKLIDRRDSLVFGYGADTMLNSKVQAVTELRTEKYIGGGTPNLSKYNPFDLTFGVKIYPKGVPGLKELVGNETRTTKFFAISLAYHLSLNAGNNFSTIGGSKHNFIVQLNWGNTRLRGKQTEPEVNREDCTDEQRAAIEGLNIDKNKVEPGETLTIIPRYKNDDSKYFNNTYYYYVDGVQVPSEVDEDNIPTDILRYKVALPPRAEPYYIRFIVQTNYPKVNPQTGLSEAGLGKCRCDEKTISFIVTPPLSNTDLNVELDPKEIGPVSAQRPSTKRLVAKITTSAPNSPQLKWNVPSGTSLEGNEFDRERTLRISGGLMPGVYPVTVVAALGDKSDESNPSVIKVNTPPIVTLHAENPKDLQGVRRGDSIELIASVNDTPDDSHTFVWQLSDPTISGQADYQILSDSTSERYFLNTVNLKPGKYSVRVIAKDSIEDTGESNPIEFEVFEGKSLYFNFDKYNLLKKEKYKLDKEAFWLQNEANRVLRIRIEGNADARGSNAYNYRLACRRAHAAKNYLVKIKKINPARIIITTVSYGETKAKGYNESTWKEDRRVDLLYTRSTDNIELSPDERIRDDCSPSLYSDKSKTHKKRRNQRRIQK